MFEAAQEILSVDAAHFFSRVLQVGRTADIEACRSALLSRFDNSISRAQSWLAKQAKAYGDVILTSEDEPMERVPQLERVASLLLDVGSDLPALRLASLVSVSGDMKRTSDPWFVRREVDETSRLSYARRLYNDAGSSGSLTALARTFSLDPNQLWAQLSRFLVPLTVEANRDWAYVEGTVGRSGQVEIEAYWDGFVSIDLRVTEPAEFDRVSSQLVAAVASLVSRPVLNLGDALLEAVLRENGLSSS
jgi:hypothetical protein